MNYDRPDLLDRLAADYAVGLLRHRARARFERLCTRLAPALNSRQRWEDRLLPLALAVPPVMPAPAVWQQLQRRIDELPGSADARRMDVSRHGARRWWLAAAASLVAVVLFVGRETWWAPVTWQAVAVLEPANQAPLWSVERDPNGTLLSVHTLGTVTLASSSSYELWVLPRGAGNPVSLGLLPRHGSLQRTLTAAQRQYLLAGAQVAVSIEPSGGSPTGLPTGPVVIVAPIAHSS